MGEICYSLAPRWGALTRSDVKRALYSDDMYFREGWGSFVAQFGSGVHEQLHDLAFAMFKPEAILTRNIEAGLEAILSTGYLPRSVAQVTLDRLMIREAWRYQMNNASDDRIALVDLLDVSTPCLFVMLQRVETAVLPAAVHLSGQKGPSDPAARNSTHIRSRFRGAQNKMITHLHCADEPADLVRELAVFFDSNRRGEILRACAGEETADTSEVVSELYRQYTPHDLSAWAALDRLQAAVDRSDTGTAARDELAARCAAIRDGRSRDWRGLVSSAATYGVTIPHWDVIAIGAEITSTHLDGVECLIPPSVRDEWVGGSTPGRFV